jgi:hypothetical protein
MDQEKMYALVEQWSMSGLSKRGFSKNKGISYHSFLYWAQKWDREKRQKQRNTIRGIPTIAGGLYHKCTGVSCRNNLSQRGFFKSNDIDEEINLPLLEKIKLIDSLGEEEKQALFKMIDLALANKRMKDNLQDLMNKLLRMVLNYMFFQ